MGPKGDHGKREEGGEHRDDRRDQVDRPVGEGRRDPLLEEQLDAVRERDQHAVRTRTHGAHARLHVRDDLPLDPDQHHDGHQEHEEHDHHPRDQENPVEPVHQASPATGSSVAVVLKLPDSRRLARRPGW